MQIVTSSPAKITGQPPVSAKPGKDIMAGVFAGLLAALSGVTGQTMPTDPAVATQAGLQVPGSSQLPAGASTDPSGQTGLLPAADMAGPAQAAVPPGDPSVSSGPASVSKPADDVAGYPPSGAAGSLPSSGEVAVVAGQLPQALSAPAVTQDAAAGTPVQGASGYPSSMGVPGSGQALSGPANASDPVAAQTGVVASAVSGQASTGAAAVAGAGAQAAPKAFQEVASTGPAVAAAVAPQPAPQAGLSGSPGQAGSGPAAVSIPAAASDTQQQAVSTGGNPQGRVIQGAETGSPSGVGRPAVAGTPVPGVPGYPPEAGQGGPGVQVGAGYPPGYPPEVGVGAATQAVFSAPVNGPNQGQAPPGTVAPAPAGQMVPGSVSSSQPQFAPDGGSSSSGGDGKGSDPGKTPVTNPLAGNPVPVFQASTGTPVVSVAALPQQTAQDILSYLDQGGRLPAQLQLQLDPPSLGKMTVHLAMEAGTLSVTFVTASSHARDAVAASLPQMRELLSQNNLVLGHTGVYVGSQTGGSTGGNPRFDAYQGPDIRLPAPVSEGEEGIQTQAQSGSSLLNILV